MSNQTEKKYAQKISQPIVAGLYYAMFKEHNFIVLVKQQEIFLRTVVVSHKCTDPMLFNDMHCMNIHEMSKEIQWYGPLEYMPEGL